MALKFSTGLRNAQSDMIARFIGRAPVLEVWSGTVPSSCLAPDNGVMIASGQLPSDWLSLSSNGEVHNEGPWNLEGRQPGGSGSRGKYFRIKTGGACHIQGTFGPDGDMKANASYFEGSIYLNARDFRITRGNA